MMASLLLLCHRTTSRLRSLRPLLRISARRNSPGRSPSISTQTKIRLPRGSEVEKMAQSSPSSTSMPTKDRLCLDACSKAPALSAFTGGGKL